MKDWKIINTNTNEDFPEGFGVQWAREPVELPQFVKDRAQIINNLLSRFGVLVFPEIRPQEKSPREHQIASMPHTLHVDGNNPRFSTWYITQLRFNPHYKEGLDPTQFVSTQSIAAQMRKGDKALQLHTDESIIKLLENDAYQWDLIKDYNNSRVKYTHDWRAFPNSAVLYFASGSPLAKKVLHGRLSPSDTSKKTPRLFAILYEENEFSPPPPYSSRT